MLCQGTPVAQSGNRGYLAELSSPRRSPVSRGGMSVMPTWPLTRVNQVFCTKSGNTQERQELADVPQLADAWREELA